MNPDIRDLPIDERIQLVEDVWDSIAEDQQKLELTQAQREQPNGMSCSARDWGMNSWIRWSRH